MGFLWLYLRLYLQHDVYTSKFQLTTTIYALAFTTNLQIHTVTCCIHLHIYRTLRIPYPFQFLRLRCLCSDDSNFSDCFSINVAILFLSFKRAIIVPNKLIDSQHHKRLRRKTLRTAFHSLSHFTLTTTRLNLSFLKTLNYSKTIQRLILSFRNPTYFIQT